jgi:hypothetical protein
MSKCSKSCNPNANFERLKEIDILLNCVMGIANLEATRLNGPNCIDDLFQKVKSRLMYLIPGEGPCILPRSDVTPPVKGSSHGIIIDGLYWKVIRHGDTIVARADVDAMKSTAVVQFSSKQDVAETLARATRDIHGALHEMAHDKAHAMADAAAKKSKSKVKPGGTLKAKVKTVSSVETVKAKAKKKGKA